MKLDGKEDPEEDNPTLPEEMGPIQLQRKSVNLEHKRGKKEKRLAEHKQAIEEQHNEIAMQQAKLVEMQAAMDAVADEIRVIGHTRAEVLRRVDQLNADRLHAATSSGPNGDGGAAVDSAGRNGTTTEAFECVKSAFFGLQTFKDQPIELQNMLRQFVGGIDSMRTLANPQPP